jgi:hypothetical protein
MTGLRYVEAKINAFEKYEFPYSLPPLMEKSVQWLDPFFYINRASRTITNSFINSTVRLTTACFTTVFDLSYGVLCFDKMHLKDGIVTIPKAICHLVFDAIVITSIVSLGIATVGGLSIAIVIFVASEALKAIASLVCLSAENLYYA